MTNTRVQPTPGQVLDATTDGETELRNTGAERRLGRIAAWTGSALRDVVYCGVVLAWSIAAFTILVTGAAVTASLLFLVVGVFVWIGFVHVLRWTTWIDRRLAGWQRHEDVPAAYRRPVTGGFIAYLRTLSSDPQTWKNMAWLAMTSIIGFAGGLAVIAGAALAATYASMPLWYWAASDPHQEIGVTIGLLSVDTLGEVGIAAVIGLLLMPLVLLVARWFAATHAGLAVRMLAKDATP
jgi:hypothetical protein